jgi:hypothetical protein
VPGFKPATACGARVKPARMRWHGGLPRGLAATRLGRGAERVHRRWSPRVGHARGGGLAQSAASNRAMRCGESGGHSTRRKRGRYQARWNRRGRTEAAARRRGEEVGSVWRRAAVSSPEKESAVMSASSYSIVHRGEVRSRGEIGRRTRGGRAHRVAAVAANGGPASNEERLRR